MKKKEILSAALDREQTRLLCEFASHMSYDIPLAEGIVLYESVILDYNMDFDPYNCYK